MCCWRQLSSSVLPRHSSVNAAAAAGGGVARESAVRNGQRAVVEDAAADVFALLPEKALFVMVRMNWLLKMPPPRAADAGAVAGEGAVRNGQRANVVNTAAEVAVALPLAIVRLFKVSEALPSTFITRTKPPPLTVTVCPVPSIVSAPPPLLC